MLKLFVTGDNHIGLKYASHEKAPILVDARISAFEGMVEKANEEECNLFVITGDLFENTYSVAKRDIVSLVDMLSKFKGTVAVLPGNHDYYDKEVKVWQYFEDVTKAKDNIMLLSEYKPYSLNMGDNDVVLYPALCTSLHSELGENNLGWIKEEKIVPDSTYRIGVAHGAIEGETIDSEGQYFLMNRSELDSIPVDVWLIGHTHVPFPKDLVEESYKEGERVFNAGTHVQTDVSCNTSGYSFIIQIDSGNGMKKVKAKKVNTGNIRFYRKNITLTAEKMETILKGELDIIPDNSVVDIILNGAVTLEEYENRINILNDLLSRFIEGTYNDYSLSKMISEEIIDSEFSETSFSASFLKALLDEPKEAQLAYEMLKAIKEGK